MSQMATCSPAHQPLIQGQGWQNWNDSLGERLPDLINLPQSQPFFSGHCLEASNGLVGAANTRRMATSCWLVWFSMQILESQKKKEEQEASDWIIKLLRSRSPTAPVCTGSPRWFNLQCRRVLRRGSCSGEREQLQRIS